MGKENKSIKKVSFIVLIITGVFFIWYVSADRHTPYTDQARIQGLITPVSPRVSGFVTEINIIKPPIVGVPFLRRCDSGPQSRIG